MAVMAHDMQCPPLGACRAGVVYNASGAEACFDLGLVGPAAGAVGVFDYQVRGWGRRQGTRARKLWLRWPSGE
jgi:hypothetical protein